MPMYLHVIAPPKDELLTVSTRLRFPQLGLDFTLSLGNDFTVVIALVYVTLVPICQLMTQETRCRVRLSRHSLFDATYVFSVPNSFSQVSGNRR